MTTNIFGIFQLMGGILLSVGYIPQIKQIIRNKSSDGLNLKSFETILSGIVLYEIYAVSLAVRGCGIMYLITNTVSMLLALTMCLLIKIFKKPKRDDNDV